MQNAKMLCIERKILVAICKLIKTKNSWKQSEIFYSAPCYDVKLVSGISFAIIFTPNILQHWSELT